MHTRVFVKIVELSSYYHPTQSTLSFMLPYGPSMLLYYIQFNLMFSFLGIPFVIVAISLGAGFDYYKNKD